MKKVPPGQLGKNILEPINILSEEGVEPPNYQIVPLYTLGVKTLKNENVLLPPNLAHCAGWAGGSWEGG